MIDIKCGPDSTPGALGLRCLVLPLCGWLVCTAFKLIQLMSSVDPVVHPHQSSSVQVDLTWIILIPCQEGTVLFSSINEFDSEINKPFQSRLPAGISTCNPGSFASPSWPICTSCASFRNDLPCIFLLVPSFSSFQPPPPDNCTVGPLWQRLSWWGYFGSFKMQQHLGQHLLRLHRKKKSGVLFT